MSHIKLLTIIHTKSQQLIRRTFAFDELAADSFQERAEQIRAQKGLKRYGVANYLFSLAMHDSKYRKILNAKRKEADKNGKDYHRERELS